ncbi:MAG: nucleotidyltransferase [Opitutaceae bacterium]
MDGEPEPSREVTRVPNDADLVSLARELNRLGVAYVVVGGFAINRLGFVRATEDIDLLIARDHANQALVKQALEILPDRAVRELGDEDIAQWVVVRVNDDITVDLMTEAGGVRFEDTAGGTETAVIDGVPIPFAGAELMLKMKQSVREKDAMDRSFLEQLIRCRPPRA